VQYNGYVALEGLLLANSIAPADSRTKARDESRQGRLNFQRAESKAGSGEAGVGNNRLLLDKELQSQLQADIRRQQATQSQSQWGKGSGPERQSGQGQRRGESTGDRTRGMSEAVTGQAQPQRAGELEQRQIDQLEAGFAGQALNAPGGPRGRPQDELQNADREAEGRGGQDRGPGEPLGERAGQPAGGEHNLGDLFGEGPTGDPRGLSLPVTLPGEPTRATFGKSGGDPRLAVSLMPVASYQAGWGVAWAIGWLTLAGALIWAWSGAGRGGARWLSPVLFLVGAAVWLLTSAEHPVGLAGLVLAGVSCWGWMRQALSGRGSKPATDLAE